MDNTPSIMERIVKIGVCTTASESTIKAFISKVSSLTNVAVQFIELPYNDLDSFHLPRQELDGVIICHSMTDRRGAITDVMDALYDNFLPRLKQEFGHSNVCAIAHDFAWPLGPTGSDHARIKDIYMDNFRRKQPTTFECCNFATICGRLDEKVDMDEEDWNELWDFIVKCRIQPVLDELKENSVGIAVVSIVVAIVAAGVLPFVIPLVMKLYHGYVLHRLKVFLHPYRVQQQQPHRRDQGESPVEFHEVMKYLEEYRYHVVFAILIIAPSLLLLFPKGFVYLTLQIAADYALLFFLVPFMFRVYTSRRTDPDSDQVPPKDDWYWPFLISSTLLYLFVLSEMYRVGGLLTFVLLLVPLVVKAYQIRKEFSEKQPEQWFSDLWDMIKADY